MSIKKEQSNLAAILSAAQFTLVTGVSICGKCEICKFREQSGTIIATAVQGETLAPMSDLILCEIKYLRLRL
jgi:hypothetical protein